MIRKAAELLFLPVLAVASLIMLLHEFRPMLWRACVRPVVCNIRARRRHNYVLKTRCVTKAASFAKTLVRSFDNEIRTIIRLIRLESEEVANSITRICCNNSKNIKESMAEMSYSLFA